MEIRSLKPYSIFWFRRDLRLNDNRGLFEALSSKYPVLPIFIFDTEILGKLHNAHDARVGFIYKEITKLKAELEEFGSDLRVFHGKPKDIWVKLVKDPMLKAVYVNRDYEPRSMERDEETWKILQSKDKAFHSFKDQVIFEKHEVLKKDGKPYTVFTPYKRRWLEAATKESFQTFDSQTLKSRYLQIKRIPILSLEEVGFKDSDIEIPSTKVPQKTIKNYNTTRDIPSIKGTSKLGIHFRFGTISIREKARKAQGLNDVYLSELIWRDFYQMILFHFPKVVSNCFKPAYEEIRWRSDEKGFEAWCQGQTGYPMVDAGMRELLATGYMHNRVRMVVASFLCKHLLIDYKWGEAWFARHLLDFDLAANNGGWQWAAGTGCDAAPYFRVFNPASQQKKFDPEFKYIKKWIPEFGTCAYPEPIVEHKFARQRALDTYKASLAKFRGE